MTPPSMQKQFIGLVGWLGVSFAASGVGAIASLQAKEFYGQLTQPSWAPPASIFGPMWTVLFTLMGIAAWFVWNAGGIYKYRYRLLLFIAQLVLNGLWSWLFFAWHLGAIAFIDIVALWILIVATLVAFWRVRPIAGVLLIPYLVWVSSAGALNFSVWQLNPHVLT